MNLNQKLIHLKIYKQLLAVYICYYHFLELEDF